MSARFDVAILGGGPGGYVAAVRAAQLGLKVAVVEKDPKLGGTCLHRGCIPTKALLHYSDFYHSLSHCSSFGIKIEKASLDMEGVHKSKSKVVKRMAMGLDGLMKKNDISVIAGKGRLESATRIVTDKGETIEANNVIRATGSVPVRLPLAEIDGKRVFTSDEILEHSQVPDTLIVMGAGAVGLEFACVYSDFGAQVEVVEMLDRALPLEDEEISKELQKAFAKKGIKIHTSTRVETVKTGKSGVTLTAQGPDGPVELKAEALLMAVGRAPMLEGLGLEELGVERAGRYLKVDQYYRTSLPNLYAIGDIVPGPQLAHVASAEGIVAVEHIAGHETRPIDYQKIPSATYCKPEVASVGLTEAQAIEAGRTVKVGRFPWAALGKASIINETEGLVKIVADEEFGELLGVHIIGPHATDLIAEACVALACEATVEELFRTVHAHPTLSEAIPEAAHGVFGQPIHLPPARRKRS